MKDSDGMLALLQDIKELLWGIALLSAGGFLCLIGIVIGDWGIALLAVGIFVMFGSTGRRGKKRSSKKGRFGNTRRKNGEGCFR